jgi:hypothetical protein
MSAFIDRAAVESGDETDVEQSDDEALHVDGYDVGDGFVVGGGEESDATELAEARASLRSVATDSEFAQDLRGRRQAELEEEMRLLARDRGVQIARRRKRLKNRPAAAAQSDVASALGDFLDSCVAEEAAAEEGERRELERQRRETKRKQRAAYAAKAPCHQPERAPRSSKKQRKNHHGGSSSNDTQGSDEQARARNAIATVGGVPKMPGRAWQWICSEIEMKRSPPVP